MDYETSGHLRSAGECLPSDFFSPVTGNVPLFLMITLPPHCIAIFARKRPRTSRLYVPLSRHQSCSMFVHEIRASHALCLAPSFFFACPLRVTYACLTLTRGWVNDALRQKHGTRSFHRRTAGRISCMYDRACPSMLCHCSSVKYGANK